MDGRPADSAYLVRRGGQHLDLLFWRQVEYTPPRPRGVSSIRGYGTAFLVVQGNFAVLLPSDAMET
jgi:hypothetical protein